MQMRKLLPIFLLGIGLQPVYADETIPAALSAKLAKLVPGTAPSSMKPAPVSGLYEVMYGPELFYMSADGRYLFRGDILDLKDKTNLSEKRRSGARITAIDDLGESSMVVFAPEKTRHTVSVFTDIDCPYCRKFHQEVGALNKAGVKVRYLAFPRAGVGSKGYQQAVSVWCSDDRPTAMTAAKAGKELPKRQCENPIVQHYEMGRLLGITGTPTIITGTGEVVPGYVPADRLVQALEQDNP